MRLPVNMLLYVTSVGLLGLAGYTFYECLQINRGDVQKRAYEVGIKEADDLLARGKGQGPVSSTWNYDPQLWGDYFRAPNLTGKEPKVEVAEDPSKVPVVAVSDQRPLDEIIELVSLVCDTSANGEGGRSHVIVRYRPTAEVQPPRWYQLENQPVGASAPMAAAQDMTPGRGRPTGRPLPNRPTNPTSTMPMSSAGQEMLQVLWVAGDGTPKNEATLWPPFEDIRLIKVESDVLSARFRRAGLPNADGTPGKPVEEDVYRSAMDLSPDLKKALVDLQRTNARRVTGGDRTAPAVPASGWQDVPETKLIGNTVHISRADQQVMQSNAETFLDRINVDPYVSRTGSGTRGLRIVNVAPDIAQRFGVQQNDLIISVNDEPVSTKADALAVGRRLYNRGVRTFTVKFLSDGRPVERVYQAPDR